ncbi:tRNA-intron lyase [Candidatus Pacearchaeota archaeon]|nr:tRNA-intron lyase [Candidatus Pacearchaeota archaeon]
MITATISQSTATSTSPGAFTLYERSRFGEKKDKKIIYSLVEALHLQKQNKLSLVANNKPLTEDQAIKKAKRQDKDIATKLTVFSDLRNKGYVVKTALKFGAEFRIYDKGTKPGKAHAKWIGFTAKEHDKLSYRDLAAKNRVAHSTKKHLLLAIVDDEDDVTYYDLNWLKP